VNRFPGFGKELQRPFEVDERCYDCAEFYHGCNARPENPSSRCADYLPLPDAGVNGQTGQEIPPSRMGGRKDPSVRLPNGAPVRVRAQPEPIEQDPPADSRQTAPGPDPANPAAIDTPPRDPPAHQTSERTRQQSPAGVPGPDGQRLCTCGTPLRKRERCCRTCRLNRRKQTMNSRRTQLRPSTAVDAASDVPFIAPAIALA